MTISSRTPEGEPLRCPVCGGSAAVNVSDPAGDSVCPACGYLLWQFRDAVGPISGIPLDEITLSSLLREDLGVDSLAVVELVMELEDKGIVIADEDYMQFRTVRDVIEYLRRHPPEGHN